MSYTENYDETTQPEKIPYSSLDNAGDIFIDK